MIERIFTTKDDKAYINAVIFGDIITYTTNDKKAVYAALEEDLKGEYPNNVWAAHLLQELDMIGLNEISK